MDELPVVMEWRREWCPGVTIDGVWIPDHVLGELAERPQNTEVTYQEALLVPPDVKEALVSHQLASEQTRGGVYAGPAFAEFYKALERPQKPRG